MASTDEGFLTASQLALRAPSAIQSVAIHLDGIQLQGELLIPANARGLVLSMFAAGCIRELPRHELIARQLQASGLATLFFQLLTSEEEHRDTQTGEHSFDVAMLAGRLLHATRWGKIDSRTRDLGMGYLGTGMGAAASLVAAAQLGYAIQAVVSYSGLPDAAGRLLGQVAAPTLLIVGERDEALLQLNRRAFDQLHCRKELAIVPEAEHAFAETGASEYVAMLAADWFRDHLKPIPRL